MQKKTIIPFGKTSPLTDDFQSLNDWRGDYGIKTEFELTSVYPEIKTE